MTSVEIRKSKSERLWSIAGPLLGVVALAFTSSAYVGLLALAVVAAGVAIFSGNLNQFVRDRPVVLALGESGVSIKQGYVQRNVSMR